MVRLNDVVRKDFTMRGSYLIILAIGFILSIGIYSVLEWVENIGFNKTQNKEKENEEVL